MVSENIDTITDIIFTLYGTAWDRLWTSYVAEYNPIWNVDGTETVTETRDLKQGHTGTDSFQDSGDDVTKNSGSDSLARTGKDTQTVQNSAWAFDSQTDVPTEKSVTTVEPGSTDTQTYGKSETLTHGKQTAETRDLTDTDTGSITTKHERGGNIGVTMTQQMLEADLEYWSKAETHFYERVCKDIVDKLTYKIYSETDESNDGSSSGSDSTSGVTSVVVTQLLTSGVPIAEIEVTTNE